MEVVVLVDDSVFVPPDGDEESMFVVFVSVLLVPPAGEGFTIVVLFSVFFSAGAAGVTVSVFCSQAARSAAPARMQMYFFIFWMGFPLWVKAESNRNWCVALPVSESS